MTKHKPQAVITPEMRKRISRIANNESLKYALRARSSITAYIQRLVDSGVTPTDVQGYLNGLEGDSGCH